MREIALTEWLNSPETRTLLAYLRQRKAAPVQMFLAGRPVDLVQQGRAAAFHEIDALLSLSAAKVSETFHTALKEQKTT